MFLQDISKFISNYRYEQATVETVNTIKAAFLDFLGVTIRGSNENSSLIAFNTIEEVFGTSKDLGLDASIIGKPNVKTNILDAAFLNGISAHVLELDDGHRQAQAHLGAVIFPTALAISEAYGLSGKDFFEAVIVGYEVGILLGKLVNPRHRNRGFHTTGTIGTFVSGAVASKLLKLDESQTLNALGLCGTQAAGLLESDHGGSMGKVLHVGKANYNGLLSAFLARNGFTGAETIIEGSEGFLKTMVFDSEEFESDDFSFESVLESVGTVRVRDIYFKKYPFCRHLHSSIDTALKLRTSLGEEYNHIENVAVKTYNVAAEHNNFKPKNLEELKQSLPYAVAISLVVGEVDIDKLNRLVDYGLFENYSTVDKVNSIKNLVNKMIILSDDKLNELYPNKRPSNVIIKLDDEFRNGIFQNITFIPKGDFENPYDLSELIDKFKSLNPDYNINNLVIIDEIVNYSMSDIVGVLNAFD
ncbi:MmgE/PrpD family protein [Methanobrevibacter millerae]|uniref:2-methylcitrate dehydratase PrpD n=1 Tax=Methanobrevibacter millerae TaxID=230361 RepID=A0A1G5VXH7_9EURY|nr:MmgE/PrpD family protein [Methanobrevibacter millerae]SDA50552.1 2-methylcitrate dehydratase PrpD [Methanobrevibacter millerae]